MENPKRRVIKITAFLTLSLTLGLMSCSEENHLPHWVIGKWSVKFTDYSVEETWTQGDDKLIGETLWSGNFKSWKEKLTLYIDDNDRLVYRTIVDSKSTYFVCENLNADTLLFVNNSNDFPKRLHYVKPVGNKMMVWIDNKDDDPDRIDFHFQKIK